MRRLGAVVVLVVMAATTVPAAAVTEEDVERARARVDEIRAEADEITRQIEDAWQQEILLSDRMGTLRDAIAGTEAELVLARQRAEEAAVRLYMAASTADSAELFFAAGGDKFEAGIQYLESLASEEEDAIDRMVAIAAELDQQRADLDATIVEQAAAADRLKDLSEEVQAKLIAAGAEFQALEEQRQAEEEARRRAEEEERRRAEEEAQRRAAAERAATSTTSTTRATAATAATPTTTTTAPTTTTTSPTTTTTSPTTTTTESGTPTTAAPTTTTTAPPPPRPSGGSCPVDGPTSFRDTWGAPRSGGRSHEGVDMMAARGTPLVAIYDGYVRRMSTGSLGGISLWIRSNAGDDFYYAHMDGYASGISVGTRVGQGQLIGYVGSTGNAPAYLPHLHFEYHPGGYVYGGGTAVNPYPLVRSICP